MHPIAPRINRAPQKQRIVSTRLPSAFELVRCFPLALAILFASAMPAWAQRRFQAETPSQSEIIFAPRELSSLIEEGKQSIARSQWAEASQALGAVLGLEVQAGVDAELDQDYFLEEAGVSQYSKSIRGEARKMLDSLPEAGQKFVELRYGVNAKKEFDEAVAQGNSDAIAEIARRYSFTEAGRNACWLVAEKHVADGNLFGAAMQCERLLQQPRARAQFGIPLAALTAACWKGAGQQELALRSLRQAIQYWPKTPLKWNGRTIELRESDADLAAALQALDLGSLALDQPRSRQWLTMGGRSDNNAHSFAAPVMPIFRWDQEMHPSIQDQSEVRLTMRNRGSDRGSNLNVIPSRTPLVVDPWVIVRTYDQRTVGIDQRTGKKVWDSTFEGPPVRLAPEPGFGAAIERSYANPLNDRVARAVWGDSPLGQLTCDGKLFFGVSELSAVEAVENVVWGANIVRSTPRMQSNVLRAWSLDAQGALVWEVGSEKGLAEPALAGALFLGAPTPFNGELLSIAEINGEVFLLGLNAADGKLKWRQQLVASSAMPIATDDTRRNLAAVPSVYGRIVVCPTINGYLVAYDLSTRSLLWAHRYEQSGQGIQRANVFGGMTSENFDPMQSRSVEYAPLIANGVVVHMPSEPGALNFYALDLMTGASLWSMPRDRWRYLGGVFEEMLLVIGDFQALGLNLREGKRLWKDLDFVGSRVVGRGARNGAEYYVPLSTQEMARMDIREGKISQRYRVENSLGNLVATDRALVSVSPLDVRFYVLRERPNAASDIETLRDPDSAAALAHQAELALGDGDLEAALTFIKQAYHKDPKNNDITRVLSIIGIQAIKADFAKFGPMVREFDNLLAEGVDGTLFLTVMIDGYIKQKKYVDAFDKLLSLSMDPIYVSYPGSDGNTFEPERGLTVQLDRWIRCQFERLWEEASESERQTISTKLKPIVDQAREEVLHLRRRRVAALLDLPILGDIALSIARDLRKFEDYLSADQLLCQLANSKVDSLREAARRQQVEMYHSLNRITTARQENAKLTKPLTDLPISDLRLRQSLGTPHVRGRTQSAR